MARTATCPIGRFHKKVVWKDGCWGWNASTINGYGQFGVGGRAHRFSYELYKGVTIPEGMCVLHKCDNPICSNPDHLFLGTRIENNEDKVRKGRCRNGRSPGEKNGWALLTNEQAASIRMDKRTAVVIAKEYFVRPSTIYNIRQGKTYRND